MNKRKINRKTLVRGSIFCSIVTLLIAMGVYLFQTDSKKDIEKIEASTVVTTGDFRLTANNKWDNTAKRNYAQLDWDDIPNLTQSGYKLFQSEDGSNWENRSLSYGKGIKVLNVYPDIAGSNTLKGWMDGLGLKASDNTNLIQVTPVTITNFNANPDSYLKNGLGEYQYDVVMFGSWDCNNFKILNTTAYQATRAFVNSGRGALFGHDTIAQHNLLKPAGVDHFLEFRRDLGIGFPTNLATNDPNDWQLTGTVFTGAKEVKILNDGYLMKYPFEMANGTILNIPYTHNTELSLKSNGAVWAELINPELPFQGLTIYEDQNWRGGWYLKTNNNVGMIQTGHSNGQSSVDERKIIANTLYNLAQVSLENDADDYSVLDDKAPEKPEAIIRCGSDEALNLKLDAKDKGKEYQFYVEADTRDNGLQTSDVVKEDIVSNIAGYFYELTDSPTTTLATRVESLKDEYGRIDPSEYDFYVAPDDDSVDYETAVLTTISEKNTSEKYVHVLAVDRANNISAVSSKQIRDLVQPVDFEVERTADEAKLVDVAIDASIGDSMKSIEIQIPKNTEIKEFASLTLPTNWYSFENSETADYLSFSFAMETNSSATMIETFLKTLRFTIKNPVDISGSIKIILHEKVYTSWIDPNGVTHYYAFVPIVDNWLEAYNSAKTMNYRGLTGYLATLTSEEEHNFVYDNISKKQGWLGGTRFLKTNPSNARINDDKSISSRVTDFTLDATIAKEWYWANGPESGMTFFTSPRRSDGSAPPGVYEGFDPSQPANGLSNEPCLQFGLADNNKYWHDIPYDGIAHVDGYYLEFSEYGNQVEADEITDVCWNAAIPQKIYLDAFDEEGNPLTAGNIVCDQNLKIGEELNPAATPKEIEFYTFLESQDATGVPKVLTDFKPSATAQRGKLIYSLRRATMNIRQVILNPNDELVIPKEGYLSAQHRVHNSGSPTVNNEYQLNTKVSSDIQSNDPAFTKVIFATGHLENAQDQVQLSTIVQEFYKVKGYSISNDLVTHTNTPDSTEDKILLSRQEIYDQGEFWITFYLEPNGTNGGKPQPYSWDYKQNDLGKITE